MTDPIGTIFNDHKGAHVLVGCGTLTDALHHAQASAARGVDGLYRFFDGSGFVLAFSVLRGVVRVHREATIPSEHWHGNK